jgi:hypothetical protein
MVFSSLVGVNIQNTLAYTVGVPTNFGGTVNFSIPMYGRVGSASITTSSAGAKVNVNFLLSNYKWNIYKDGVFFTSSSANGTLISPTVSFTLTTSGAGDFTSTMYMGHLTGSFTPSTIGSSAVYTIYFYGKLTITSSRTGVIFWNINAFYGVQASSGGTVGSATNGTLTYTPASFPTFVATSISVATPTVSSGSVLTNVLSTSALILPSLAGNTIKFQYAGSDTGSYIFDNNNNLYLRSNNYVNIHGTNGLTFGTGLLQSLFGSYTAPTWNGSTITSNTSGYYYLPYNNSNRILIQFGASVDRANTSITFDIAYVSIPYVYGIVYIGGNASTVITITAVSATAFTIDSSQGNGNKAPFNWFAIGLKQN